MKKRILVLFVVVSHSVLPAPSLESIQGDVHQRREVDLLLFAPDNAKLYKELLLWLMETTDLKIEAALYRLTDRDIHKGLLAAYQRGVEVEIILDPGAATDANYSLGLQLCRAGISTHVYNAKGIFGGKVKGWPSIMHHKTFVFTNKSGLAMVAFGSLNPTTAGFHGNQEAMQVRTKNDIVAGFREQFELLKERSRLITEADCAKGILPSLPAFFSPVVEAVRSFVGR